jgi:hypothetical protein
MGRGGTFTSQLFGLCQAGDSPAANLVGPGEIPDRFAGCQPAPNLITLEGGQLGFATELDASCLCRLRPPMARPTILCLSSSAIADRNAMKRRPIGVVRSKCARSSTFRRAPLALIRSISATPSSMERVARSHSATTRMSPVLSVDGLLELGAPLG